MSQKQGSSKKKRDKKVSEGRHGGGGKVRLTELNKVLLGKGRFATWKPDISPKTVPWKGSEGVPQPYDAQQAELNRRLYPHLFN